ncbi:MAG: HAD-IB family phosphatase [Candidatus Harrisonbacteria bacterium]|nr:HAD-IB family phosphatase [Candidatus Harrisonbacteria bacterium]
MEKRKVAIFDIDGTIFRSSLLVEVTDALIQEGLFPASARRRYAREFRRWSERRGTYHDYIEAVIEAFGHYIMKVPPDAFRRVARRAVAFHKNRVYRYTRDMLRDLKRRGYFLLAITHSPKIIADMFCKQFGFNKVYGRLLEIDARGRFTGRSLNRELIDDKSKILLRAAEREGLTLRGSVGVGDTEGDISFLKLVEKPICFNPNEPLYTHAKRVGWSIVVERKDVIYRM